MIVLALGLDPSPQRLVLDHAARGGHWGDWDGTGANGPAVA